jgi:hypothetical protein
MRSPVSRNHICQQAAAHADLAMDTPDRDVDPLSLERFAPGQYMLIDVVDQRAVKVEQE